MTQFPHLWKELAPLRGCGVGPLRGRLQRVWWSVWPVGGALSVLAGVVIRASGPRGVSHRSLPGGGGSGGGAAGNAALRKMGKRRGGRDVGGCERGAWLESSQDGPHWERRCRVRGSTGWKPPACARLSDGPRGACPMQQQRNVRLGGLAGLGVCPHASPPRPPSQAGPSPDTWAPRVCPGPSAEVPGPHFSAPRCPRALLKN